MGKSEGIRVFLRLRPPAVDLPRSLNSITTTTTNNNNNSNNNNAVNSNNSISHPQTYAVEHTFDRSIVRFHVDRRTETDVVNNTAEDFRFVFRRAFEPNATQEEVFNTVAKECVLAAVDGYNSTIFAYGQTGSGKTFSITGGTESYNDRGIIPRALALIYEEIARRQQQEECVCNITISYLQIYNDKGQDLLNHGRDARKLEELPQVTVHESEDEVVLKGLAQHSAPTTEAALNLLFLGDTNRLYCETPMNKTSSRSHCVFTVYIETRPHGGSGATVRRSKLNLVDLAGSERVAKTGVRGTVLTEAKHINLSLHYLEQVIMALSEQASGKRDHVPFRNSFMTMVLRDSLGSNCRTSMLATAHPSLDQLPETISTCRFAQRVALIKQEAHINEEIDPHLLVRRLKIEVQQLRDQLAFYTKDGGGAPDRVLSDDEKLRCTEMVDRYVADTNGESRMEGFDGDLARIYYCFDVMKRMLTSNGIHHANSNNNKNMLLSNSFPSPSGGGGGGGGSTGFSSEPSSSSYQQQQQQPIEAYISRIEALEMSLQQKENEMNMLFDVLQRTQRPRFNAETQTGLNTNNPSSIQSQPISSPQSLLLGNLTSYPTSMPGNNNNYNINNNNNNTMGGTFSPSSLSPSPLTTSINTTTTTTTTSSPPVLRRALPEHLQPAQATAVDEFFRKQQQLNEVYDLSALTDADLLQDRAIAFEAFKRSYRQCTKVEENKRELKGRYETCKATARQLNETVDRIKQVKAHIQRLRAERAMQGVEEVDETERAALEELTTQKNAYNELAESLRQQKEAIDAMHIFMKRAQEQLTKDFEDWLQIRQKQLTLATGGSGGVGNHPNKLKNGSGNENNNNNNNGENTATLLSSSLRSQSSQQNEHASHQQSFSRTTMGMSLPITTTRTPPELPPLREEKIGSARTWGGGAHSMNIIMNNSSNSNSHHPNHHGVVVSNTSSGSNNTGWSLGNTMNSNAPLNPAERLPPHPATAPSTLMTTGQGRLTPPLSDRASSLTLAPLSFPSNTNTNGWMNGGNGTTASTAASAAGNNVVYSNSHHPNMNSNSGTGVMSSLGNTGGSHHVPNPYAPEHRSTGDAAADKQLAELYKARDAMRLQFQS
ncbi:kinesin [Trypanosoma theileri]|uniref:Kinesin n=1 Tax=Trypanosoma theileri TaxID=67003 RepID=A0A1X0NLQ3_9TRYP|nr:kinesin [Trypanosoma theileri]ORC85050.1 kinesin [Trypanosoma theileri]